MSLEWIIEDKEGLYRGPASVGVIKGKTGWILIDTTVETAAIKKVVKALPAYNLDDNKKNLEVNISAVINTHSHADHCGGNAWLSKYSSPVFYASQREAVYIEAPHLEPHYLFSAEAPKALKGKFFVAESSKIDFEIEFVNSSSELNAIDGKIREIEVDGVQLKLVDISGHSPQMMGVVTGNNTFYCGDLLFTPTILDKHPMLFLHDYEAYLASVRWCKEQTFPNVVLTHGGHFTDHVTLAEATEHRLLKNQEEIFNLINEPIDEWSLHQKVAEQFELNEDFGGWHLNHGVIRSYLGFGLKCDILQWQNGKYEKKQL